MNDTKQSYRGELIILGFLIALGLTIGGWALGSQIKTIRLGDRYVSVRGLAERPVKSDLAIWPLSYTEVGDDLPSLYSKAEADKKVILQFLNQQGIHSNEIQLGMVGVFDNQANRFNRNQAPPYRYVVNEQIMVETSRVDEVAAAAQKTINLVQQGIVLSNNGGPQYRFTGLNSIKPDMITEATRNARAAAERFASDSGSTVGAIRQANQGVFSILPFHSGAAEDGEFGGNADNSLMKTVRVVSDVEYYLVQ